MPTRALAVTAIIRRALRRWRLPSAPALLALALLLFALRATLPLPLARLDDDDRPERSPVEESQGAGAQGEADAQKLFRHTLGLPEDPKGRPGDGFARELGTRRNLSLAVTVDCTDPDILALAWGSVGDRMNKMCWARAAAAFLGARLCVLWMPSKGMEHVAASDLFRDGVEFVHQPSQADQWQAASGKRKLKAQQVNFGACRALVGDMSSSVRAHLFVSPDLDSMVPQLVKGSCLLQEEAERCYNELVPSRKVASLVTARGNNLERVQNSRPVYIEDMRGSPCGGCPIAENRSTSGRCVLRFLTKVYLRDPSADFTVASAEPGMAQWVADVFDTKRAPLVPMSARFLDRRCQRTPPNPLMLSDIARARGPGFRSKGLHLIVRNASALRQRTLLQSSEGTDNQHEQQQQQQQQQQGERLTQQQQEQQRLCAQHELALLLLLASGRGSLLHMARSPESDFILAVQRQRAGLVMMAKPESQRDLAPHSICPSPFIYAINRERYAKFFVVEEELNLAYCAVPKVACTGWKMWLRTMLGLPDPLNQYLAHSYENSGLGDLSKSFQEEHAVRLMTRPDMFKFVLVRNPFTRIPSTYLNKLVYTDAPDRTEGWGTRKFWNKEFFGQIWALFQLFKNSQTQLVTFDSFLCLINELQQKGLELERHIAPQTDLCGLDDVKYNFVGKFETLAEDVKSVTARFGHKNLSVFKFNVHPTNTDSKLQNLYTKAAYDLVYKIYHVDFNVSLNHITFEPPASLREKFGEVTYDPKEMHCAIPQNP